MKKVLIAGEKSYIGCSLESYIQGKLDRDEYRLDTVDMIGDAWRSLELNSYDCIVFVAGIVHVRDKVPPEVYYKVNCDLPIEMAKKAKDAGVKKFIFMSTMSVYGDDEGLIDDNFKIEPKSHYGISKYKAEQGLFALGCEEFKVFALRPPMVYGKGCKGNYNTLAKFVKKIGVFPNFKNERSMIYIDNLCCFIKKVIDGELDAGVWLPQNKEYVNTAEMARLIAEANGKKVFMPRIFNPFIKLGKKMNIEIVVKCFGSYRYSKTDERNLVDETPFDVSVMKTEGK